MSLNSSYIEKLSNAILRREIVLGSGESIVVESVLAILKDQEQRIVALENPPAKVSENQDTPENAATGFALAPEVQAVVDAAPNEAQPGTPEAVVHLTGTVEGE